MRPAHPIERAVGIDYYVSDADGTGGFLKRRPEDFVVRELEDFDAEPLDADVGGYPFLVVRATLHGWDTNDFAGALSNALGISRERISWAGTKDKHAVTTQLFTIRKGDPDEIPDLSGADIEVVGRAGRDIHFGDLAGNAFTIRVTDPERPDLVESIAADLVEFGGSSDPDAAERVVGVPNYFGQQRFGSRRPVTHEVGLSILAGRWEEAVMAYVGNPFEAEPDSTREARTFVEETRDYQAALDRFPRRLGYERSMLHRLVENGAATPADFREALEVLPSNLQQLFVNAAQSYVFNRILSERLERGLPFDRAVAGDVICFADRSAPEELIAPDVDRLQVVTEDRVEAINRHCERGRAFVTAPLVGVETTLSDGEPGEIERDVLDEVGVEPADFDLPGQFHSTGTRRAILLQTALAVEFDPLTFSFSLPSGSYATVVLREFLQTDPLEMG